MSRSESASPAGRPAPDSLALFLGFARLGLIGFGGVLPFARRIIVEERHWLTAAEFTDLLGLCQVLPGGNIINVTVCIGLRYRGIAGALASFSGLMLAPTLIVLLFGTIYDRFHAVPEVSAVFAGLSAAAAGLLAATAMKIAEPVLRRWPSALVALGVVISVGVLRWPLLPVLPAAMMLSLALHRRQA